MPPPLKKQLELLVSRQKLNFNVAKWQSKQNASWHYPVMNHKFYQVQTIWSLHTYGSFLKIWFFLIDNILESWLLKKSKMISYFPF